LTSLQDRIISSLWKKYHKAENAVRILEQEIISLEGTIRGRENDKQLAEYWRKFYREQLAMNGEDVIEE
jgi:hypothetical protein